MTHSITPDQGNRPDQTGRKTPGVGLPKILIVDDENLFRCALKKELVSRGYEVADVQSGSEAIPVLRRSKPEIVILDQMMPVMDGFETLKKIKKIHPAAQVIMLTGYGNAETACEAGRPGIFRCLKKPCAIEEIVEAIEAAVLENVHEVPVSLKQWVLGLFFKRYRTSDFLSRFRNSG
ncbi:MAG: response regulator [Desulfobacteraceae bacterium]|nr:MAG: response regulator [Desulfobacteraceae bacterium]